MCARPEYRTQMCALQLEMIHPPFPVFSAALCYCFVVLLPTCSENQDENVIRAEGAEGGGKFGESFSFF